MQRIVFLYNLFSKDTSKPPNPDKRRKIRIFGVMNTMNTKAKGYIIGSIAAATYITSLYVITTYTR